MQQLEIQYFYPLTEQIPLDLDFTPSENYVKWQRDEWMAQSAISLSTSGMLIGTGVSNTWATLSLKDVEPNFTIDIDQMPITVLSKQKPSLIRRYIYKVLGMKWKAK